MLRRVRRYAVHRGVSDLALLPSVAPFHFGFFSFGAEETNKIKQKTQKEKCFLFFRFKKKVNKNPFFKKKKTFFFLQKRKKENTFFFLYFKIPKTLDLLHRKRRCATTATSWTLP